MIRHGDAIEGPELPEAEFVFGGYSAREGRFHLFKFAYSTRSGSFEVERVRDRHLGQYILIGDVARQAETRLHLMLRERERPRGPLDMEPLEVIRDMLRAAGPDATIGGAPQVAKVHRHMTSEIAAVDWSPDGVQPPTRTVLGRPILDYEVAHIPALNADDPAPLPPQGRGAQLRELDDRLMETLHQFGPLTADELVEWGESNATDLLAADIEDWLDFASRRGLIDHGDGDRFRATDRGA
jgi:hypothetical protein